ncbi:hypothetical protein [Nonomuraea longicatena]|uniref:Lipoprotein n=1 Tax=Nonomuraea longicatena TaxID=83682 RepID=A0ABN1P5B0_9ACTN
MTGARVLAASLVLLAGCAAEPQRVYTPGRVSAQGVSPVAAPTVESTPVGSGVSVRVEWPAAPDPMLRTYTGYYAEAWKAVLGGGDDYLGRVEGPAAADAQAWVRGFDDHAVTGTALLHSLAVSAVMGDGAQVNACVDETGLRLVSRRTREPAARQPDWTRRAYLQAAIMHKGDDGVWRIKDFRYSKEGCDR